MPLTGSIRGEVEKQLSESRITCCFWAPTQYLDVTGVSEADLKGMKCSNYGSINIGCCSLSSTFLKWDVGDFIYLFIFNCKGKLCYALAKRG